MQLPLVLLFACFVLMNTPCALSQVNDILFDEAKVPSYVLPDPLQMADGTKVTDAESWRTKCRPELLHLFEEHITAIWSRTGTAAGRPASAAS